MENTIKHRTISIICIERPVPEAFIVNVKNSISCGGFSFVLVIEKWPCSAWCLSQLVYLVYLLFASLLVHLPFLFARASSLLFVRASSLTLIFACAYFLR